MAIQIIGNVGNQGYALPMVSAYPLDVNSQYLLAWNPTQQALDYVPYVGNALGDFTVTRDLTVGRNAVVAGTFGVTGVSTFTGSIVANGGITTADGGLEITGGLSTTANLQVGTFNVGAFLNATTGALNLGASKVLGPKITGWGAPTGTATRTTFATGTVTLPILAEHVKALIDDLTTHGMIGV